MHQLDRATVQRPPCLDNYDGNVHSWDDLQPQDKRALRLALQRMQGGQIAADDTNDAADVVSGLRCAYCESQIYYGGHIEHFRRKNPKHFPQLTFAWTNLFLSCDSNGSKEHCGHYKDRPGGPPYNPDDLIKPDEHDPDDYLYFHSSGEVRVRHRDGMTDDDRQRAAETIRVFHLDCGRLNGARRKTLKPYLDRDTGFLEALLEFDEKDRQLFIAEEIEATKREPFWTTIRHFFEKYAP